MPQSLVRPEFNIFNAESFIASVARVDPEAARLYFYIARQTTWEDSLADSTVDEQNPPNPSDTLTEELQTRSEMIAAKRMFSPVISHVVPRHDWEAGTVYAQWDAADQDIFLRNFYVLTDEMNVYKCLDNAGGAPSTVKPTGTAVFPIITGDGYEWKFMYRVPNQDIILFLADDWLPVPTGGRRTNEQLLVEDAAVYTPGDPLGGHGSSAFRELGASFVMVTARLESDEDGQLIVNVPFRKFGLWLDPSLDNGDDAIATIVSAADLDLNSGRILYVEHRPPITRALDQTEDVRIVLQF